MGTGTTVKGKGVCNDVELTLGEWVIVENFLPLALGGVDIVLGMQWLYTLGVTVVNWRSLTMRVNRGDNSITLKEDPSLTKTKVSLKTLMRSWEEVDQGFLVECRAITIEPQLLALDTC